MPETTLSTVLTEADHEFFLDNGYVRLRGLVPRDALDAAVGALETLPQAQAARERRAALMSDEVPEVAACLPFDTIARAARELAGPQVELAEPRVSADAPPRMVYI